jgi:hypothetical protein
MADLGTPTSPVHYGWLHNGTTESFFSSSTFPLDASLLSTLAKIPYQKHHKGGPKLYSNTLSMSHMEVFLHEDDYRSAADRELSLQQQVAVGEIAVQEIVYAKNSGLRKTVFYEKIPALEAGTVCHWFTPADCALRSSMDDTTGG